MMNRTFVCNLFMAIWLMNLPRLILASPEPPQSYLSASELLELYSSMYSSVHNMSVKYTDVVEEIIPDPKNPNALDNIVRYEKVERTEEGDKYNIRHFYSTQPDAIERPDRITEHAFDGSVTMVYIPQDKTGSIALGRTGRTIERKNDLLQYMLLDQVVFRNTSNMREHYPNGAPFIEFMVDRQGTVRPYLERIGGEWCHVVDTTWPGLPGHPKQPGTTTWFAAEKGGLPMKFEKHDQRSKYTLSIVVEKVAAVDDKVSCVWYPQEAVLTSNTPLGTTKHRFVCHELRVNIETSKDTWKFSFPVGTYVVDHVLGVYYVVGSGETPGSEPMIFGTLAGSEINESIPTLPEIKDSETQLGNTQDLSIASTEPNKAEVLSKRRTEGSIDVTTGRKQFAPIAVVLFLLAVIACGVGIFLGKRNAGRSIERT